MRDQIATSRERFVQETAEHAMTVLHDGDAGRGRRETWEWDLREYDWQFLWCCWAIVWGIGQYRAAPATEAAGGR